MRSMLQRSVLWPLASDGKKYDLVDMMFDRAMRVFSVQNSSQLKREKKIFCHRTY